MPSLTHRVPSIEQGGRESNFFQTIPSAGRAAIVHTIALGAIRTKRRAASLQCQSSVSSESLDVDRRPGAPLEIRRVGEDLIIIIPIPADKVIAADSHLVVQCSADGTMLAALYRRRTGDAPSKPGTLPMA